MGCGNFGTCSGGLLMARVNCNLGSSGISMCPGNFATSRGSFGTCPDGFGAGLCRLVMGSGSFGMR
jgi:hypothetical protein